MPWIFIQHLLSGSLGLLRVQRKAGETRLLHLEFTDLDPMRPTHLISFVALYSFPHSSIKYNFLLPYLQIFAGALNAAGIPFLTVSFFFFFFPKHQLSAQSCVFICRPSTCLMVSLPRGVCQFTKLARTKHHRLSGLNNSNIGLGSTLILVGELRLCIAQPKEIGQ